MILRERIVVKAPAERVWAILSDPGLMSRWNFRCVRCASAEPMRVGLRFKAIFRLSGPELEAVCEVIKCEPNGVLTLRLSSEALPRKDGYIDDTFVLRPARHGTKVVHRVDLSHSGLPWWVRTLMTVMKFVGYKAGKSPLDGLKELAEGSHC